MEILKQGKQEVQKSYIRSAIFFILLIWCYQIIIQYEETYEHQMRQCCSYDLPKIKSIDVKYLKHINFFV